MGIGNAAILSWVAGREFSESIDSKDEEENEEVRKDRFLDLQTSCWVAGAISLVGLSSEGLKRDSSSGSIPAAGCIGLRHICVTLRPAILGVDVPGNSKACFRCDIACASSS